MVDEMFECDMCGDEFEKVSMKGNKCNYCYLIKDVGLDDSDFGYDSDDEYGFEKEEEE